MLEKGSTWIPVTQTYSQTPAVIEQLRYGSQGVIGQWDSITWEEFPSIPVTQTYSPTPAVIEQLRCGSQEMIVSGTQLPQENTLERPQQCRQIKIAKHHYVPVFTEKQYLNKPTVDVIIIRRGAVNSNNPYVEVMEMHWSNVREFQYEQASTLNFILKMLSTDRFQFYNQPMMLADMVVPLCGRCLVSCLYHRVQVKDKISSSNVNPSPYCLLCI